MGSIFISLLRPLDSFVGDEVGQVSDDLWDICLVVLGVNFGQFLKGGRGDQKGVWNGSRKVWGGWMFDDVLLDVQPLGSR